MPSGRVHDQITIVAAGMAAPVWLHFSPTPKDLSAGGVLIAALLFSGLAISPDLDLNSGPYKRWGIFRFIWWPYQKLVPHRSYVSHSPVLGPLIRVAYFLFVVWGLFRVCSWVVDKYLVPVDRNALSRQWTDAIVDFWKTHPHHLQMLLLGLFLGAFLHTGADLAVSALKRRKRRR